MIVVLKEVVTKLLEYHHIKHLQTPDDDSLFMTTHKETCRSRILQSLHICLLVKYTFRIVRSALETCRRLSLKTLET